jgi:predicted DNA-binding transcriptional regulator AlpA
MKTSESNALIPAPQLASEFGVTRRTLHRWINDPAMSFPPAARINHRLYFDRAAVDAWKAERLRASLVAPSKAA